MDRPLAGGFLSLTAFQAEGCGIALSGDEYKVSVTDLLSVSYGMISILLTGSLRSPPPIRAAPLDTPLARGFRGFRGFKRFRGEGS